MCQGGLQPRKKKQCALLQAVQGLFSALGISGTKYIVVVLASVLTGRRIKKELLECDFFFADMDTLYRNYGRYSYLSRALAESILDLSVVDHQMLENKYPFFNEERKEKTFQNREN